MMGQNKKKLYILSGIPGIGKSTWIQNHKDKFEGTTNVVSRDAIRFTKVKSPDEYFKYEKEVWAEFVNQAIISLNKFDNTILDATHINPSSRGKILRALKNNLVGIEINTIAFCGMTDTAIKRNSGREGLALVPVSAILNMSKNFTIPTKEEGFDNIYIYDVDNNKMIKKEVI